MPPSPPHIQRFTKATLPDRAFPYYRRKITETAAVRIDGPFEVETLEGVMRCEDGWLALDVDGNPYPIASDVFERTFNTEPLGGKPRDLNPPTGGWIPRP